MNLEENNELWDKLDKSKKNIYKVPDGYFEDLPQIIQAKAVGSAKVKQRASFVYTLKYVIPVVVILIAAFTVFFNQSEEINIVEEALSEISTEELIDYLAESEMTTDEIIASVDFGGFDLDFGDGELDILDDEDISEDELDGLLDDFTVPAEFL